MPIRPGWEVSSDRVDKYEKMVSTDPLGDVVITSKCRLNKDHGFLIASDNGFGWRLQMSARNSSLIRIAMKSGKNKWVRWHDVDHFFHKKEGLLKVYIKARDKKGSLRLDYYGNPKLKKWTLRLDRLKNESKPHFIDRKSEFYDIMAGLHNQYQGPTNPPISDSRV